MATILVLMEATIGPRLLLSSRLAALGYEVTVLSAPRRFRTRIEANRFDWLILDGAAVGPRSRRLLAHVARHRHGAGVAWLGAPSRRSPVPIDAVFAKPLRYGEITRFFSDAAGMDATWGLQVGTDGAAPRVRRPSKPAAGCAARVGGRSMCP